jgi:hypothetical protein
MQTPTTAAAPTLQTDRAAFRHVVSEIAAKAKETLPECNGRVDKAVAIVLAGDVALQADGTARVASQSNGTTTYFVVNGECNCPDVAKAPSGWCKHRIAAGLAKRVAARVRAQLDASATRTAEGERSVAAVTPEPSQSAGAPCGLPEAPVSITLKATLHGHEVLVTLRGVDFASVKVQVEAASQWLQAQGGQPTADTPQCPTHGVAMKLNHGKDGSTWHSHRLADGSWCKGK